MKQIAFSDIFKVTTVQFQRAKELCELGDKIIEELASYGVIVEVKLKRLDVFADDIPKDFD